VIDHGPAPILKKLRDERAKVDSSDQNAGSETGYMSYQQAVDLLRQRGVIVGEGAMRHDGVILMRVTWPDGAVEARTSEIVELAEIRCSLDDIRRRRLDEVALSAATPPESKLKKKSWWSN